MSLSKPKTQVNLANETQVKFPLIVKYLLFIM